MKLLFIITLAFFSLTAVAQADVYVWNDPEMGLTASFPDRWETQSTKKSFERLSLILNPESTASCSLSAAEDKRFVIFPHRYYDEINANEFNVDYWSGLLSDKNNLEIISERSGGLGRGNARYIVADYEGKRAMLFTSLYGGTHVLAHCAADHTVYNRYAPQFQAFIKSIDMKPQYHFEKAGYYRDFIND